MSLFGNVFNRKKLFGVDEKEKPIKELFKEEELIEDSSSEEETEENDAVDNEVEDPNTEYEVVEREILPAKIICPDCGGITLEGLEFCDKCGGELN